MKSLALVFLSLALPAFAAESKITYISCPVQEDNVTVMVKFAIENYDPLNGKGKLIEYPGTSEESGYILISPEEKKNGNYSRMINLNGQGGDLTVKENGNIFLFGDGDGYQFTDLELWYDGDDIEELTEMEGYVRDYGPAYNGQIDFKQFLKCQVSKKIL